MAQVFLDHAGTGGGEHALDVGCGTGHVAAAVLARSDSATVHGVDLASAYVACARQQYPDPRLVFDVGEACELPYPDRHFDRVL